METHAARPEHLPPLPEYEYRRAISRGPLAEVHLYAPLSPCKTEIVLKCAHLARHGDRAEEMRLRFAREVLTLRHLDHPNIVRLLEDGEYRGDPHYLMPFCAGGDLDAFVRGRPALSLSEAWGIIAPVLNALEYIATASVEALARDGSTRPEVGVVHRDLTPRNILFAVEDGRRVVKLADWGMAKAYQFGGESGITDDRQTGGTPAYMSRLHYIEFRNPRPEIDVWSAAAVLYFMLTKQTPRVFPVACNDPHALVAEELPVPIRDCNEGVPAPVARVIDDCLNDSDELLFKSVAEFRSRLLEALAECGAVAPGSGMG